MRACNIPAQNRIEFGDNNKNNIKNLVCVRYTRTEGIKKPSYMPVYFLSFSYRPLVFIALYHIPLMVKEKKTANRDTFLTVILSVRIQRISEFAKNNR